MDFSNSDENVNSTKRPYKFVPIIKQNQNQLGFLKHNNQSRKNVIEQYRGKKADIQEDDMKMNEENSSCIQQVLADSILNLDSKNNIDDIVTKDDLNDVVNNVNSILENTIPENTIPENTIPENIDQVCPDDNNTMETDDNNAMETDDNNAMETDDNNGNNCITKKSIITTIENIYNKVHRFFFPLKIFEDNPNGNAFIYISRHGGYDLNKRVFYKKNRRHVSVGIDVIPCPVPHLYRLITAPIASCTWGSLKVDTYNYIVSYIFLKKLINDNIDIVDNIDIDSDVLKNTLEELAKYNRTSEENKIDYYAKYNKTPDRFEKKICRMKTNFVIENKIGDDIFNKTYEVDTKGELSGISIMFNTTFRLPDILFDEQNSIKLQAQVLELENNPNIFRQRVDIRRQTITYKANSELLDCPIFNMYVYIITKQTKQIEESHSNSDYMIINNNLLNSFNRPTNDTEFEELKKNVKNNWRFVCPLNPKKDVPKRTRKLLFEVDNFLVYGYFQYVKKLVHVDMSCAALMVPHALKSKFYNKHVQQMHNTTKKNQIYGGKNKKCNKQSRHKQSRRKQSRRKQSRRKQNNKTKQRKGKR
jgi:hypothetical protein